MIRISHVLCPVDFSDISLRALHHASALASWYEARLTVLHMFPLMPVMDVPPPVLDELELTLKGVRAQVEADRLQRLEQLIPAEAPSYCTVQSAVRSGPSIRRYSPLPMNNPVT